MTCQTQRTITKGLVQTIVEARNSIPGTGIKEDADMGDATDFDPRDNFGVVTGTNWCISFDSRARVLCFRLLLGMTLVSSVDHGSQLAQWMDPLSHRKGHPNDQHREVPNLVASDTTGTFS